MKRKKILKTIGKFALLILVLGIIALGTYFILRACGFTTKEDFIKLRDNVGENIWFWGIIVLLQVVQVVFIPISNQIITVPVALLFNNELWKVFLASWLGIVIGTIILYFIGRFGGKKLLNWLLSDKEQADRCVNWLKKGKAFYLVGMFIGFIPDDILTTLAGTSKYNFWYVLVVSIVSRGVCCALSVWGFGYLTHYWWGWLILGVGLSLILLLTIFLIKREKKQTITEEK